MFKQLLLVLAALTAMALSQTCPVGCASCEPNGFCTACDEGYYLSAASRECVQTTTIGCQSWCTECYSYYTSSTTTYCIQCSFGLYVSNPTDITPCSLTWYLILILVLAFGLVCGILRCICRCCCKSTSSSRSYSLLTVCPTCKGGKYLQVQNDFVAYREDCPRCKGTGYV